MFITGTITVNRYRIKKIIEICVSEIFEMGVVIQKTKQYKLLCFKLRYKL